MDYTFNCTLDRVIDGDTIDAYIDLGFNVSIHKRIRLYGIDAPETRTKDLEEKSSGLLAKARLVELLDENNNKFLLHSVTVGKFGRCIGRIYTDPDKSINTILIEESLAVPYNK